LAVGFGKKVIKNTELLSYKNIGKMPILHKTFRQYTKFIYTDNNEVVGR